jgi:hypothetical protein
MMLIHVFLDNARYHHAKLVQQWLARPGCRIKLHFIPSYCPHLNPIERLWGLGAYASKGGKSFICLASSYEKRGARKSRIVLELTPGNIVTTPRSDVMYVATEYGMTNLKGKSVAERATAAYFYRPSRFSGRA